MIFLVVLMLGATTIMQSAVQDERITGNSKASTEAFFAAEAGYRSTINYLLPKSDPDDPDSEVDKEQANSRWKDIYAQVKTYDDIADWQEDGSIDLPQGLNPGQKIALSVAPVYETITDEDGVTITQRAANKIRFVSKGTDSSGRAERSIGFDLQGGGGAGLPPAPAAISCFGGDCIIRAGAANKAPISGVDHPLPSNPDCNGNNCRTEGDHDSENNVPAVYLSNFDDNDSKVEVQGNNGGGNNGGGNKVSFEGADRNEAERENFYQFIDDSGKTKADNGSIWGPADYDKSPKDTPLDSEYAGPNATLFKDIYAEAEGATSNFNDSLTVVNTNEFNGDIPIGDNHHGILIVEGKGANGTSNVLEAKGNGYFAGLIIIKDCNSLSFKGTPYIFGAVIVDATDCPDDYRPFVGTGNPEVLYSSEALDMAGSGISGGLNGDKIDWYEITGN
jgi:hypothetical protein